MSEDDVDYHIDEDLEQLFHSDLQNLDLGHDKNSHDDVIGDHLPEWLVGVIVVIIMLIIAFFVMIITSIVKNRQKNRSSTYISTPAIGDDLESGKIGNGGGVNMKMTSFSTVSEGTNGKHPTDTTKSTETSVLSDDKEKLTNGQALLDSSGEVQGCRNPLFVDDDPEANRASSKSDVINGDVIKSSAGNVTGNPPASSHDDVTNDVNKSKGKGSVGKHKQSPQKSKAAPGVPQPSVETKNTEGPETSSSPHLTPTSSPGARAPTESSETEVAHKSNDDGGKAGLKLGSDGSRKLDLESCCEDSGIELCNGESNDRSAPESRSHSLTTEEGDNHSSPTMKSTFHLTEVIVHGSHSGNHSEESEFQVTSLGDKISVDISSDNQTAHDGSNLGNKGQTNAEIHCQDTECNFEAEDGAVCADDLTLVEVNLTEDDTSFAMSTNL